jgi:hypothetical protein
VWWVGQVDVGQAERCLFVTQGDDRALNKRAYVKTDEFEFHVHRMSDAGGTRH